MAKKTYRSVSRGRKLTAEEADRYRRIREEIAEEFPPAESNVVKETVAKLRDLREAHGLSLAEMEERTGMTRANLCRLEKESTNITLRTLERYAKALDCEVVVDVVPAKQKRKSQVKTA